MEKIVSRFCNFIFGKHKNNSLPRIWILLVDISIVVAAYAISLFLIYYNNLSSFVGELKFIFIPILVYLIVFLLTKTYDGMLRYSGFNDIVKIFRSCCCAVSILVIGKLITAQINVQLAVLLFPRYIVITYHFLITMTIMVIMRLTIRRIYNEVYKNPQKKENTIIYGAGDAGTMLQRTLSQDTESILKPVVFIDDNTMRQGNRINTIKVLDSNEVLTPEYIKKHEIKNIVLAIPSLKDERRKQIIERCLALGLNVKTIPSFNKWIDGKLSSNQVKDIKIEDLLGRNPIMLGKENVQREIKDKVVLVTGAAGSIGSEICRQVMLYEPKMLIMLDQAESPMYDFQFEMNNNPDFKEMKNRMTFVITNVKDLRRIEEVFAQYKPQIVYHAAAYKHVPFMEENAYEAVYVNVFGTKNVADMAMKYGAEKFVMISTDKAVNPTNVMGATKRIAEIYTQSRNSGTKFVTTRFGNVLGSNGSVVPLFRKQIEQGGPITVTDKRIIRFFMTIPEACSLVLEAGSIGENDDIFVFDMGEPVKIWDLAERMRQLAGKPEIKIVETGLRPGEKLYEELLATKENTVPTENEKIMRAKVRQYEEHYVNKVIEVLYDQLLTLDEFKIVGQMKNIIPEFKSNNSVFSKLDK